jgi:Family of unknown function (DUF6364)
MTVKLNLTIDKDIVVKSKGFASKRKTTVSKIVQELLRRHISQIEKELPETSFTKKYAGSLKTTIPNIRSVKDAYLKKKYGA